MEPPPWDALRDEDLDPAEADRLRAALRADADPELELQRALTAWSANTLAGDVRRAFLARVTLTPAAGASRRRWRGSRPGPRPWLAGAMGAVMLSLVWLGLSQPWVGKRPVARLSAVPEAMATIDGRWIAGAAELAPGAELAAEPGATIRLDLGASRILIGHPTATTRLSWHRASESPVWDLASGRIACTVRRQPEEQPWRLRLPQAEVRVVGTSFSLQTDVDRWQVAVHSGTVTVHPRDRSTFPVQRLDEATLLRSTAAGLQRLPLPEADARPVALLIDRLHADDAAALLHLLLAPTLELQSILVTWDGHEQTELTQWCSDLLSALGREAVVIAHGSNGPLTAPTAPLSAAAERLRRQAAQASTEQPLLVLSLGTSRSVVAEVLRQDPRLAKRMALIEVARSGGEIYGHGRDPVADAVVEASDLRRDLVRVTDPAALSTWPDGLLSPLLAQAGPAATAPQVDAAVVVWAEGLGGGATTPDSIDGASLVAALRRRWRQRGPKTIP